MAIFLAALLWMDTPAEIWAMEVTATLFYLGLPLVLAGCVLCILPDRWRMRLEHSLPLRRKWLTYFLLGPGVLAWWGVIGVSYWSGVVFLLPLFLCPMLVISLAALVLLLVFKN
jgi:membrane-associated HD superfamily phosphohydrolase